MRNIIPMLGDPYGEISNNLGPDGQRLNYVTGTLYTEHRIILLGKYDGNAYDGTDRLGRNVAPAAVVLLHMLAHMSTTDGWTILLEGDRLATRGFLDAALTHGRLRVIRLLARDGELAARRAARTAELDGDWLASAGKLVAGRPRREGRAQGQDATWLRGRASKVRNLSEEYSAVNWLNDTRQDQERNTRLLAEMLELIEPS